MSTRFLTIEGPIGVGKSTLAKTISEMMGVPLVQESFVSNPSLDLFYSDMKNISNETALATETWFMEKRFELMLDAAERYKNDRLVVSDFHPSKGQFFLDLTISQPSVRAQMMSRIKEQERFYQTIGFSFINVLLLADSETLQQSIRRRGRANEQNIPKEYLEVLTSNYLNSWVSGAFRTEFIFQAPLDNGTITEYIFDNI